MCTPPALTLVAPSTQVLARNGCNRLARLLPRVRNEKVRGSSPSPTSASLTQRSLNDVRWVVTTSQGRTHFGTLSGVQFRVLGMLDVLDDGRHLNIGGGTPRRILGVLLSQANRVVSADSLIEAVWGDNPPPSAA